MVDAVLTRHRFDVVACEHGAEAIALLSEPFDVIILDLMMPRKSGYDVLHFIEQNAPHLLGRVIVTTANAAVIRTPLPQAVAATVIKPFDLAEFLAVVNRVMEGS